MTSSSGQLNEEEPLFGPTCPLMDSHDPQQAASSNDRRGQVLAGAVSMDLESPSTVTGGRGPSGRNNSIFDVDIQTTVTNGEEEGIPHHLSEGLHGVHGDSVSALKKFSMNPLFTHFHKRRFTLALSAATPRLSSSRRMRNRLVQKGGICNISLVNVPKQGAKYFRDIFTTVIEMKWRWCLLIFCSSFTLFWTLFTAIYYLLVLYHGDFEHGGAGADVVDGMVDGWTPCIAHGSSALNIFIFAFTTQSTIGYGYRYPTDECPLVVSF